MENKKQVMTTEQEDFAKRRRVIKGLVSTPVLMTLANTAEAQVSAHQCLTNQAQGTEPVCNTIAQGQIPGWASYATDTDNNDGTGSTVDGIAGADHYCVGYGTENPINTLNLDGLVPKGTNLPVPGVSNFINQDGSSAGNVTGNPIAASCLASFINTP